MKAIAVLLIMIVTGCGGTLTDEQRKKVKQEMKDFAIKKVSEAQITEAAFILGRTITKAMEQKTFQNRIAIDSLQQAYQVKIISLRPDSRAMQGIEQQIIEAYTNGSGTAELTDNIQRLGTDSILYTKPMMRELPDGSLQFNYALGIKMAKKVVVLTINE